MCRFRTSLSHRTGQNLHAHINGRRHRHNQHSSTSLFNIPIIDDKFNRDIKRLLTKHNILARLTYKRGLTSRSLTNTTPARKTTGKSKSCPAPGICQRSSVVYEATCTICGKTYIGMTTRKLHERAREHTTAALGIVCTWRPLP